VKAKVMFTCIVKFWWPEGTWEDVGNSINHITRFNVNIMACEVYGLMGLNAMQFRERPTFARNIPPPSSIQNIVHFMDTIVRNLNPELYPIFKRPYFQP
jgi:hypothetical protein